jgi:phosphatidylinositol alpha-1,6-mannosyltransferase
VNRKKLLLITGVFPPGIGGMQSYYHYLCLHSKWDVTVLAPHYDGDAEFDAQQPYKIIRGHFFENEKVNVSSWWRLYKAARHVSKEVNPDVTIYGYILIGFIGLLLKWITGNKYLVSTHGKDMLEFRNIPILHSIVQLILRKADGILANSAYTKKLVLDYGVKPEQIALIYPGVDGAFEPADKDEQLVNQYGLAGKYVLFTTGRLVRRKGHDRVIEALPTILQTIPEAVYLIIGDGPERSRLESLATEYGVAERVIFTGSVETTQQLGVHYNLGDQFIMSSRVLKIKGNVEGFGIVYMEAASCKKPIIAGDSGGVREAVLDGETGVLVPPGEPQAIADAVIHLYKEEGYRKQLIERAYARAKNEFQYPYLAGKMDAYLERVHHN